MPRLRLVVPAAPACGVGMGGADAARGSGLRGLTGRVAALDGTLAPGSPPGLGTRLHVEIPA